MAVSLFPDSLEMNYRKNHLKHVQSSLDGIIMCAICNLDLKQNIILNDNIMLQKTFLCLCCKNCFEKLSDSPNDCIFCSSKIQVKTCEMCYSKMCKRCIDNYYLNTRKLKTLKHCLKCSFSVLWNLRSLAAAILKCFSVELSTRLLLNGEECEDKQHLRTILLNSSKCTDSYTQEEIYNIRVKYVHDLFNSKIQKTFDAFKELKFKNSQDHMDSFSDLFEQILVNTCLIFQDIKCFFNEKASESLNNKIMFLLKNGTLLQNSENFPGKNFKKIQYNTIEFSENSKNSSYDHNLSNIAQNQLSEKKEDLLKQDSINKLNSDAFTKTVTNNTENIAKIIDPLCNAVCLDLEVKLLKFDGKNNNNHVEEESLKKLNKNAVDQRIHKEVSWNPVVKLVKFDEIYNNNEIETKFKNILSKDAINQMTAWNKKIVVETVNQSIKKEFPSSQLKSVDEQYNSNYGSLKCSTKLSYAMSDRSVTCNKDYTVKSNNSLSKENIYKYLNIVPLKSCNVVLEKLDLDIINNYDNSKKDNKNITEKIVKPKTSRNNNKRKLTSKKGHSKNKKT